MDRKNLPQELKKWAEEEMGLPTNKVPSAAVFRKLCVGQCADIWKFVTHYTRGSRNVKIIEGNLRWYQHLQQSEVKRADQERRKQLLDAISMAKSELQQLELQLKRVEQEVTANELSVELSSEKLQDSLRRTLLLKAYSRKKERERAKLRESSARIKHRVDCFHAISRKSNVDLVLASQKSSSHLSGFSLPDLEPEVLRDVKKATLMRYQFMKSLFDDSVSGPLRGGENEELRRVSHQQWLSVVETLLSSHPPNHLLSSLEHLAHQNALELQELTACTDINRELEALMFRCANSHLEDVSEPTVLPSVHSLIQEGWGECEDLWVSQISLQARMKDLSARLASVGQEVSRMLSDGTDRSRLAKAAFLLELRAVTLKAYRDSLVTQCCGLEHEALEKKMQLLALKHKQRQIQEFRLLVERKQEQIQILIKGNSCSKSQLHKTQKEIQQFLQRKLLQPEKDIELEVNRQHGGIEREVKQFSTIYLPCLQLVTLDGVQRVPAHDLSIHRLNRKTPPDSRLLESICQSLGFPLYKTPEKLLLHVCDLKAELLNLQGRALYHSRALSNLQQQIQSQEPGPQAVIQMIKDHNAEQISHLVPLIQRLIQQCTQTMDYGQVVQRAITDWWEEPAQFALSWERRHGLTLQQWLDRWILAVRTLQQRPGSWA